MEDSIMSNEDAMDMDEDEDSPDFMSPAGGAKVSRSPSPSSYHQGSSNSPLDHPVGRGSVRASNRLGGLKSVISEEEKSPIVLKKNLLSSSSKKSSSAWDNTSLESMDSKNDYKRVSSRSDSDGNSLYNGSTLSKDRSRLSSLPTHPPPASTTPKNGKRDSSTWHTTDDHNDDYSTSSSSNIRRRYSSEEVHELAEISRQLNVICNEYAASNSTRKPRRGRPPASGAAGGGSGGTGGHNSFGGRSVLAFGFEKPDTHYSFTKCDLFTYDDEDGVLYDQDDASESQTEKEKTVVSSSPEKLQIKVDIAPPSEDRGIIESLIRACQMSNPASSAEKSIVAAILSFCLSTHPQDPDIAVKIVSHLIICPMLAEEFELYCKALSRGMTLGYSSFLPMWTHLTDKSRLVPPNSTEALSMPAATTSTDICVRNKGGMSALEDLKRDWKTFSLNYIHRTISSFQSAGDATASTNYGIQLNLAQHEAVNRCATIWFQ